MNESWICSSTSRPAPSVQWGASPLCWSLYGESLKIWKNQVRNLLEQHPGALGVLLVLQEDERCQHSGVRKAHVAGVRKKRTGGMRSGKTTQRETTHREWPDMSTGLSKA